MEGFVVAFPLQLVCQLVVTNSTSGGNIIFDKNSFDFGRKSQVPEGYISYPELGVAYKSYHTEAVTWDEAKRRCAAENASLAVTDSAAAHDAIMKVKPINAHVHIGISRVYNGRDWTSARTGASVVSTVPWARGEPAAAANFQCGGMWNDGRGVYAWDCQDKQFFVCELPIQKVPAAPLQSSATNPTNATNEEELAVEQPLINTNATNGEELAVEKPLDP